MLSFVFPLLADSDANMNVQIFVLRKDTADIIGKHVRMKEPVYSLDGNHLSYLLDQPFILSQLLGQWVSLEDEEDDEREEDEDEDEDEGGENYSETEIFELF